MNGVRAVTAVALRELRSRAVAPLAWAVAAAFLTLSGLAFFQHVRRFDDLAARYGVMAELTGSADVLALLNLNEIVVAGLYRTVLVLMLFVAPLLTMRTFADDRASGVEEWLSTAPIGPGQLVTGKYLGVLVVALAVVGSSAAFLVPLFRHGDPEAGPAWAGLAGLALATAALTAIGVAASAWAQSQTLAAASTLVVGLTLHLAAAPARSTPEAIRVVLEAVALPARCSAMGRGAVSAADVTYFASLVVAGLFAARVGLAARRWP